jgi:LPPG:FO 2-phospho-L-lactate transferase
VRALDTEARGVVALSGGTGSAKFLRGLRSVTQFTAIANVGDNSWFHGLYVCPDIDTVTYTLAGIADSRRGWGIEGDKFTVLDQLKRLGAKGTWFNIGDLDLATDIVRTALMREGQSLTAVTSTIAERLGVEGCHVVPATDQHIETRVTTADGGEMHLQEFWVRARGLPTPRRVRYKGARSARPSQAASSSMASARRIIFCPANPITSILPTLSIPGFRSALRASSARRVAVSPMVGEGAFSGPAAGLMAAKGLRPNSEGVARLYKGLIDVLVLDETDRPKAKAIEGAGVSCLFTSTLMSSREDEVRLAKVAMEA